MEDKELLSQDMIQRKERKKRHQKKKLLRSIISFLLAYLMTIILLLVFLLTGVYAGVFNDSVILNQLHRSNYFQSIHASIMNNVESVILPTGLELSVVNDVITMDMVYINSKNTIEGALKGRTVLPDTKAVKNKLRDNILDQVKDKGIVFGEEQQEGMELLSEAVVHEYVRMLDFPFIDYYVKYKGLYLKVVRVAIPTLLLLICMIILLLIKIHRYKHQGIRYAAYSMLASSIMISIVPIILLLTKAYQKINVAPRYFYDFMIGYIKWDISVFVYIGSLGMALFVGLLLIIAIMKKKIQ